MTEQEGLFTVPTRLYLTAAQRAKLLHLVREGKADLGDIVSQMVAAHLDAMPEVPTSQPEHRDPSAELRKRRAELARLVAQRDARGPNAPAWLGSYIADLEADIRRLERR